jgi:hypothetical protein
MCKGEVKAVVRRQIIAQRRWSGDPAQQMIQVRFADRVPPQPAQATRTLNLEAEFPAEWLFVRGISFMFRLCEELRPLSQCYAALGNGLSMPSS